MKQVFILQDDKPGAWEACHKAAGNQADLSELAGAIDSASNALFFRSKSSSIKPQDLPVRLMACIISSVWPIVCIEVAECMLQRSESEIAWDCCGVAGHSRPHAMALTASQGVQNRDNNPEPFSKTSK